MSIIVRPIQAALIRDTDFFTKMDPYCKVYLGGQCQQTTVCHNGGQNPTWSSSLAFSSSGDMNMRVQVWDYDSVGNNDLIGAGNTNVMAAMQQGGNGGTVWVDLFYNGRNAGRVSLSIQMNQMNTGMGMGMGNMGMNQMGTGMMGMGMGMGGGFNPGYGGQMGGGYNPGYGGQMGGMGGNPMNNNGWGGGW